MKARRGVYVAPRSVRRVEEVINISGRVLAMFPHEAECMIRCRDGIADVVVRHVDLEGKGPWSRSQHLHRLHAYRPVGLHRTPLVYQNLHGPRAASRKPGALLPRSGFWRSAGCSDRPGPPSWRPLAGFQRRWPLVGLRAFTVHSTRTLSAKRNHPESMPSSSICKRIGSLSPTVVAIYATTPPPFLRFADAVYALKMRMQLCRRHRCRQVKGCFGQSALRASPLLAVLCQSTCGT